MAFSDRINESIRGRNLGFEFLSSGKHGTTKAGRLLVGPDNQRMRHSTAETTASNLWPFGVAVLWPLTTALWGSNLSTGGAGPLPTTST